MRLTQAGAIKVFTDVRSGMAAHRSAAVLFDRSKLSFNNSRYIFK
jgi:hypothetical protein